MTAVVVDHRAQIDVGQRVAVDEDESFIRTAVASLAVGMALIPNPRPDKYGGVRLDASGAVTGFTKRRTHATTPAPSEAEPNFHFIGPQIVQAGVFAPLPDGVPWETVLQVYPELMASRPGSVRGFVGDWSFRDIGTPADLLRTSLDLAAEDGRPDRPRWGRRSHVAGSARVTRSVLWDDVEIGDGAAVHECVIADGVRIPAGAVYRRAAIVRSGGDLIATPLDP